MKLKLILLAVTTILMVSANIHAQLNTPMSMNDNSSSSSMEGNTTVCNSVLSNDTTIILPNICNPIINDNTKAIPPHRTTHFTNGEGHDGQILPLIVLSINKLSFIKSVIV